MTWRSLVAALAVSGGLLVAPAAAPAADAVYWTNTEGEPISFSNLDGSKAGNLALSGVISSMPAGLALDPADGKLFFTNVGTESIQWAYLDGSGGGQFNTAPVSLGEPVGIAIDRAAGRVYWSDPIGNRIAYANLDGSGGGALLNTAGATIEEPARIAIDPAAGRVYWVNSALGLPKVSYANLDGSGGGDISKSPGPTNGTGVALDPASGRVFWSATDGTIESSALDGSGATKLNLIGAATPESIRSVAIDLQTSRVFWASQQAEAAISFVNISGGGGGDTPTAGANLNNPGSVAILRAPAATSPPTISSPRLMARTLSCSQGGWAGDAPASLFYRAPQTFVYQWLRDGAPIAGETGSALRPTRAGSYSCLVTATNFAGSTTQTSGSVSVGPENAVAGRIAIVKDGKARLKLRCPGFERCRGTVSLIAYLRHRGAGRGKAMRYSTSAKFSIGAGKKRVVPVKLLEGARSLLDSAHRLRSTLIGTGVESRTMLLKPAPKRKRAASPTARAGARAVRA